MIFFQTQILFKWNLNSPKFLLPNTLGHWENFRYSGQTILSRIRLKKNEIWGQEYKSKVTEVFRIKPINTEENEEKSTEVYSLCEGGTFGMCFSRG